VQVHIHATGIDNSRNSLIVGKPFHFIVMQKR
jgi:hypothetical protein